MMLGGAIGMGVRGAQSQQITIRNQPVNKFVGILGCAIGGIFIGPYIIIKAPVILFNSIIKIDGKEIDA